jgi:hypothetical protein
MIKFTEAQCLSQSSEKLFGLCDDPLPAKNPAYIDETNGRKWIAVVVNEDRHIVRFIAIDHCIHIQREDGKQAKRCDGTLTYEETIILVELKSRGAEGNAWVKDAEEQLRASIVHVSNSDIADDFPLKKAYIANSEHPKFKDSQQGRMDKFFLETNYVLRIENRIII